VLLAVAAPAIDTALRQQLLAVGGEAGVLAVLRGLLAELDLTVGLSGYRSIDEIEKEIKALEKTMREAAKALEFEKAAQVRDRIKNLRSREFGLK